jgi:hypothetical protein
MSDLRRGLQQKFPALCVVLIEEGWLLVVGPDKKSAPRAEFRREVFKRRRRRTRVIRVLSRELIV